MREEATRRLLQLGDDIVISKLRQQLQIQTSPEDEEARHRILMILAELDPIQLRLQLLRLRESSTQHHSSPPILEYALIDLAGLGSSTQTTTHGFDSKPQSLNAALLEFMPNKSGMQALVSIRLGEGNRSPVLRKTLSVDKYTLLRVEENSSIEALSDDIIRTRQGSIWIGRLLTKKDSTPPNPLTASSLITLLQEELNRQLDSNALDAQLEAYKIVVHADLGHFKPRNHTKANSLLTIHDLLLKLSNGSPAAQTALMKQLNNSFLLENRELRNFVCLQLAKFGSKEAFELLFKHILELSSFEQAQFAHYLTEQLETGNWPPEQYTNIYRLLTHSNVFGYLLWRGDGIYERLWLSLIKRTPTAIIGENIGQLLEEADSSTAAARAKILLSTLPRVIVANKWKAENYLLHVLPFLHNASTARHAFALTRDALLSKNLPAKILDEIEGALGIFLANEQLGYFNKQLIGALLTDTRLSPTIAKKIWLLRIEGHREQSAHRIRTLEGQLRRQFGDALGDRATRVSDKILLERLERWHSFISKEKLENFTSKVGKLFRLSLVDIRVSESDPTKILRFESTEIHVNQVITRTTLLGDDDSLHLSSTSPNNYGRQTADTYYLGNQKLQPGKVARIGGRRGNHFRKFNFGEGDHTPTSNIVRSPVYFYRLAILDNIDEKPIAGWPQFIERMLNSLKKPKTRQAVLTLITDNRLADAIEPLRTIFDQEPSVDVAQALLALGDLRGRQLLLEDLKTAKGRKVLPTIVGLIRSDDITGIHQALAWIKSPPRGLQPYLLIRELNKYFDRHRSTIDRDKWATALVASLKHNNAQREATRMLRLLSGQNFGYQATNQGLRGKELRQARKQVVERWQRWLQDSQSNRQNTPSSPPRKS